MYSWRYCLQPITIVLVLLSLKKYMCKIIACSKFISVWNIKSYDGLSSRGAPKLLAHRRSKFHTDKMWSWNIMGDGDGAFMTKMGGAVSNFWGDMLKNTGCQGSTLSGPRMTTGFGPFELPTRGWVWTQLSCYSVSNKRVCMGWGWMKKWCRNGGRGRSYHARVSGLDHFS